MGLGNWLYMLCMFWFLAWPKLCYYSLGFENGYGFGLECRLYVYALTDICLGRYEAQVLMLAYGLETSSRLMAFDRLGL